MHTLITIIIMYIIFTGTPYNVIIHNDLYDKPGGRFLVSAVFFW